MSKDNYNNKHSDFEELSNKDNSVSFYRKNIHAFPIEMYKVADGVSPEVMNEVFRLRDNHHNLGDTSHFFVDLIHSAYNSTVSVSYLGPKI